MKFLKSPSILLAAAVLTFNVQAGEPSRLNINTASAETIDKTLVFIGGRTAQNIVDYRSQHGQFQNLDDLAKVKGVSKKLARYNRNRVRFQ